MIDGETGADDHVDDLTRMAVANPCVNKWSLRNLYFDPDLVRELFIHRRVNH